MDSQHRHELQENELAGKLGQGIEQIKPHLPLIGIVAVAAIIGLIAWNSYRSSTRELKEVAWQQYSIAMDKGASDRALLALEQVSDDHSDSTAADWAGVTWADGQTLIATRAFLRQREAAMGAIEKAEKKYTAILADPGVEALVQNRARLGLARLKDLQGEIDEAKKLYGKVGGAFKDIAEARAKELANSRVDANVTWLASAESAPLRPQFSPGGLDAPDTTPDPLALPDEEPSGDESFSDMLRNLQAAGLEEAEDAPEESSEEAADGEEASKKPSDEAPGDAATTEDPAGESTPPATESDDTPDKPSDE